MLRARRSDDRIHLMMTDFAPVIDELRTFIDTGSFDSIHRETFTYADFLFFARGMNKLTGS